MRKLVYFVATTLDGFVAGPEGGDPTGSDFFPVTPDLVELLAASYPETLPAPARAALGLDDAPAARFDTVLEGRASYEIGLAAGIEDAYPHLRHVVFSTTLGARDAVEVVATDPAAFARELKAEEGGDLWLVGGGTLAHGLLPEIDELVLKQHPSVIGTGIPLFNGPFAPHVFRPTAETTLDSGIRILTFAR